MFSMHDSVFYIYQVMVTTKIIRVSFIKPHTSTSLAYWGVTWWTLDTPCGVGSKGRHTPPSCLLLVSMYIVGVSLFVGKAHSHQTASCFLRVRPPPFFLLSSSGKTGIVETGRKYAREKKAHPKGYILRVRPNGSG